MMRGEFYTTHRVMKCRSFKKCNVCAMCENFSRYQAQCLVCETRKRPIQVCTCNPATKEAAWIIMRKKDGPMFDPDLKPGSGKVNVVDEKEARMWKEISDKMLSPARDNI